MFFYDFSPNWKEMMLVEDEDDDTHYCLKCHSTINGLDRYVAHRKTACGKVLPSVDNHAQKDETVSLKADDFFSSLELQSSAKKPHQSSSGSKSPAGVLTRSKVSTSVHASRSVRGLGQQKTANWQDSVNIQSQSQSRLQEYCESEEESDDYEYDEDDSSSDEDDDTNDAPPRSYTGGKWKPTSSPIQWSRQSTIHEERDWNAPPIQFTGGKWKPHLKITEDVTFHPEHTGGKRKSPSLKENPDVVTPTFSGGKYSASKVISKSEKSDSKCSSGKLISSTIVHDTSVKEDEQSDLKLQHTKTKWKPGAFEQAPTKLLATAQPYTRSKLNSPTFRNLEGDQNPWPTYTKGKWKPISSGSETAPSPSYTKGKWKPITPLQKDVEGSTSDTETEISPFRKSSGTVQYWCAPCNRHLASKVVYERHLKSDFHYKRTTSDKDFEAPCIGLTYPKTKQETISRAPKSPSNIEIGDDSSKQPEGRTRKKVYTICYSCKSRVQIKSIGKHLVSHYHCSKSDISLPEAKKMVLENIHSVVLQSPFQCAICKFYCNTPESFLYHWQSNTHKSIVLKPGCVFWCTICNFKVESAETMYQHLLSSDHNEIISVINRSVPVVIKKITPINCPTCNQEFLYNIQLRKHCESTSHAYSYQCSDTYQSKFKCSNCDEVFNSKISLQRHEMSIHNIKRYICSACSISFDDILEAKRHRNTPEHRYAVLGKQQKEEGEVDITKICRYCSERFENALQLKEHYKNEHPEHQSSCPYCGKTFTIAQDLGVHIRKKACIIEPDSTKSNSCDECQFKTNSTADLIFHKVLHGEPLMILPDDGDETKALLQYKCPICEKFFVRSSLRCHIRLHTKERPFKCSICGAGFVRRNNLNHHMKNHDRKKPKQKAEGEDRPYLCSTCGASFKKRSVLQQHMTTHVGKSVKCYYPGCIFKARFPADLKNHLQTHSEEKPFACDRCSYRAKTKQLLNSHYRTHGDRKKYSCSHCSYTSGSLTHMKRHMTRHVVAKMYSCPHCRYSCNNLDNLRKHIISTNKHPGKYLYECKFCQEGAFETNSAKDFKVHLVTEHSTNFLTAKDASTYITSIYEEESEEVTGPTFLVTDEQNPVAHAEVLRSDATLSTFQDTLQTSATHTDLDSADVLTSVTIQDSSESKIQDELFPMLIESKDVASIEDPSESWNIGESYDVEETLFDEHFE